MNQRGDILMGNIIFIVLNLIFLTILILFLLKQGQGAIILEQSYAKNIALLIDYSKPAMEIYLDMEDAFELAKKNNIPFQDMVQIKENQVIVKLSDKGGYSYSFFNDVEVGQYPSVDNKGYYFIISNYNE